MSIYYCVHICTLIRESRLESRETGRRDNKDDGQLDKNGAERVNLENSLFAVCYFALSACLAN